MADDMSKLPTYLWDPRAEVDPEIARLEEALRPLKYVERPLPEGHELTRPRVPTRASTLWSRARLSHLIAAAVVLTVAGVWRVLVVPPAHWHVTPVAGAPRVATRVVSTTRFAMRPGEWLETDSRSRARLDIGRIGRADVGPGTRLRLVPVAGPERRLALERGQLAARIWAPPRFFLVETPGALAIDLGCVYTLEVDERGVGLIRVQSGEVELVANGVRSIVPAGAAAVIRPRLGPGVPYRLATPARFRSALAAFEQTSPGSPRRGAALDVLLSAADSTATLTLWHLLARAQPEEIAPIAARLVQVAPPRAGIRFNEVVRVDGRTLDAWRGRLEPTWSVEPVSLWRRAWRRGWTWLMYR
jgi:hypothetical protein